MPDVMTNLMEYRFRTRWHSKLQSFTMTKAGKPLSILSSSGKYNLAINKKDNHPLGLISAHNEMLVHKINKGVSIEDVDVLHFLATFLECALIIVHVAATGLGYVVQKAFVGEGRNVLCTCSRREDPF